MKLNRIATLFIKYTGEEKYINVPKCLFLIAYLPDKLWIQYSFLFL